jgi:hypothetical protein
MSHGYIFGLQAPTTMVRLRELQQKHMGDFDALQASIRSEFSEWLLPTLREHQDLLSEVRAGHVKLLESLFTPDGLMHQVIAEAYSLLGIEPPDSSPSGVGEVASHEAAWQLLEDTEVLLLEVTAEHSALNQYSEETGRGGRFVAESPRALLALSELSERRALLSFEIIRLRNNMRFFRGALDA